ncbi:MAG: hypothetical protein UEU88_05175 [Streptococcus salivarius]|nr:hypothetical protein [Streptococcus salivarius]
MELTVTISSPVGEFTPDRYIGDNWKQIFDHISSDPEQELSDKVEEILEKKYNFHLGEIGSIYKAIYEAETMGEVMALFKADIQKALVYMREEVLPSAHGDDSFFDYVPDFCEQVAQMIYQYQGLGKEELVNGWVNNIKESEYYIDPEGISEYMNTDQDIEDQIQYMKATAIGPFHDNLVSIGLVRLIINEILENGK